MYKKITALWCSKSYCFIKPLIIMKLSFILLIVTFFQASAMTFAQKVSIKVVEAPIKEVFYQLSKQTGYNFITDASLSRKIRTVTLDEQNVELTQAIEKCFEGIDVEVVLNRDYKTALIKEVPVARTKKRQMNVVGKVQTMDNQPMQGVSIGLKNKPAKAFTDDKGNYSIAANPNDTILYSFIGYATQEHAVKGRSMINIVLKAVEEKIEDVVVVGYGQTTKADLTGSVATVDVEALQKAPVGNFDQALAGRVAGVQVTSNDGQPGDAFNIVVRGGNSLTQENSPLYVIDGFPVEGALNSIISPNDIETISILKDASATAIYGARGANGVVIIETKKAKVGKPKIDFNAYYGLSSITGKLDLMQPYEFVKYQLELSPTIAPALYLTNPGLTLDDYNTIDRIDWQELMFDVGNVQNYNLNLSGGNNDTKYMVSGNLFDQQGIIINSGYKKYQGRFQLDQKISDRLSLNLNLNIGRDQAYGASPSSPRNSSSQPYSTQLMYQIWGSRPVSPGLDLMNEPVDPDIQDTRFNPYLSNNNELKNRYVNTSHFNGRLIYKLSDYWSINIRGGLSNTNTLAEEFYNSQTSKGYAFPDNILGVNGSTYETKLSSWVNENLLNYERRYSWKHRLNGLLGFTMQEVRTDRRGYHAKNIENEDLGLAGLDEGEASSLVSTPSSFGLISFLGRMNYYYKRSLMATFSMRADGSSKFSKDNRWSYFPSGALAWNMHEEKFLKNTAISHSKIRASYGLTGNNRVSDFAYLSSMSFPYNSYYSFNNAEPAQSAIFNRFGNDDLKWETTRQLDIGYDLGLFNNNLNLTVDLYKKTTYDLLLNANVPMSSGFTTILKNVGKVGNEGIEVTLNYNWNVFKDFNWRTDFNISFNRNKVLELSDNQNMLVSFVGFPAPWSNAQLYLARVDHSAAEFFGYKWDGNYQMEDFDLIGGEYVLKSDLPTNGNARNVIQPGDIKYVDTNEDGIVNELDRIVMGNALSKHFGGFNNTFSYKNLSLDVFFQWSAGNKVYNANRDMFEGNIYGRPGLNQYASYIDRWTLDNPSNELYRTGGQGPTGRFSTRTIEDGSFLRLKTIMLSYNLGQVKALKLTNASVYVSGQNLKTWTNYSGMDPEVSVGRTILTPGFDYSAYPREKTFVLGFKCSF